LRVSALLTYGFLGSKTDHSLFYYHHNGVMLFFLVYVDDILITGNDSSALHQLIQYLQTRFAVRDMGALTYSLGIEVATTSTGLHLSQRKYIQDLLYKAGMSSCKLLATPVSADKSTLEPSSPFN